MHVCYLCVSLNIPWLYFCMSVSSWRKVLNLVDVLHVNGFSFWLWFQAEILAKYKPTVNSTLLIANLRKVNETTTKALEYFKSTRHIIVYYEEVVKNHTVSPTTCCMISTLLPFFICAYSRLLTIWLSFLVSEINRRSGFSEGSSHGPKE